jgi:hypothetical protein
MPEITQKDIIDLFEEAALTDRRLPSAWSKKRVTAWLDYSQEKMYMHSYEKANFRIIPSARDIERWQIATEILKEVVESVDHKKIIWSRAKKIPFAQLGRMFGMSRRKIREVWLEEIIYIRLWLQLHEKNKKIMYIIDKIVHKKRYN